MAPEIPPVLLSDLLIDCLLRDINIELGFDFQQYLHHVEFIDFRINLGKDDAFFPIQSDVRQLALCRCADPFKNERVSFDSSRSYPLSCGRRGAIFRFLVLNG
jgi:hypothetical protein